MKILSVKLEDDIARRLEYESLQTGKNPETVLADVVTSYVHYSGWQQDILEFSIEGAEHGDYATPEEISSAFIRWGVSPACGQNLKWSGLALRSFRKELEHLGRKNPAAAVELAKQAALAAADHTLMARAFPGMVEGSLEAELGDLNYCLAFRESGNGREVLGVIQSS